MEPRGMDGMDELQMKALNLYHSTQQGDWDEALTTFKNNSGIHEMTINSSGDTLLHVALNDYKDDKAEEIVDEIKKNRTWSVLERENDRGDTPLHCAASIGSRKMCKAIAKAQGSGNSQLMIQARNKKGETPLFLAALHGHKDSFLYLHYLCSDQSSGLWKRTSDGETVLHCAIRREHFDLAFQIILLYKDDIVGSKDEKGITPLHILANKPSAFEKSSYFIWYNKLVYKCLIVKPLMASPKQQSNNNDPLLNCWIKSAQNTQTGEDAENPGYEGYSNVAPPNYWTCYDILVCLLTLFICFIQPVLKSIGLEDLKKKKQKHVWCLQVLDKIWVYKHVAYSRGGSGSAFPGSSLRPPVKNFPKPGDRQNDAMQGGGQNVTRKPNDGGNQNRQKDEKNEEIENVDVDHNKLKGDGEKKEESDKKESAFLIAAKNGVLEILEKIMKDKPEAIHETNSQGQNVLHVAAENKQPSVFEAVHKQVQKESKLGLWNDLVESVDTEKNTILHLAAKYEESKTHPWQIHGTTMQMQWEIKWYEYVKSLSPDYLLSLSNAQDQTPEQIFTKGHEKLVKDSSEWLKDTSESCSVVAVLVAGVSFATSSQVPGGTNGDTGKPTFEHQPAFELFAITTLIGLFFSVTALIMFLSILTSRKLPRDFRKSLPRKILWGLSSLFVSIASMLISFCAAHFFVLEDRFQKAVFPLYAATCLPISFYAILQFPLYMDLWKAIITQVPQSLPSGYV